jgi:hypothetical protein
MAEIRVVGQVVTAAASTNTHAKPEDDTAGEGVPVQAGDSGEWLGWTEQERRIARIAFDAAYARALQSLIHDVQLHAAVMDSAGALWQLHDFLSIQRHRLEGRFDFRPQPILFLFASLVKDQLLDLTELAGLDDGKLAKIRAMAQF